MKRRALLVCPERALRMHVAAVLDADADLLVVASAQGVELALQVLATKSADFLLVASSELDQAVVMARTLRRAHPELPGLVFLGGAATEGEPHPASPRGRFSLPYRWAQLNGDGSDQEINRSLRTTLSTLTQKPRRLDVTLASLPPIELVVVASSTGGPEALAQLLSAWSRERLPPLVIAQHMANGLCAGLARHLDAGCALPVREAQQTEEPAPLGPGTVTLAPGHANLRVLRANAADAEVSTLRLQLVPALGGAAACPNADLLFKSAAQCCRSAAIGIVLTGMGQDGLEGARQLSQGGGIILAQDEASSVVWGMPGAVVAAGLPFAVGPPADLARRAASLAQLASLRRDGPHAALGQLLDPARTLR